MIRPFGEMTPLFKGTAKVLVIWGFGLCAAALVLFYIVVGMDYAYEFLAQYGAPLVASLLDLSIDEAVTALIFLFSVFWIFGLIIFVVLFLLYIHGWQMPGEPDGEYLHRAKRRLSEDMLFSWDARQHLQKVERRSRTLEHR